MHICIYTIHVSLYILVYTSTYCIHAVSFLLRVAKTPQSDHQWFSERQTGIPPEARAKGGAAKALAKAAFAVKSMAQGANSAKNRGTGPLGTLRPSEPAPVATRRYRRKAVPACLQKQGPRDRLPKQGAEAVAAGTSPLPSSQARGQGWEKKEMPSETGSGQGISCRATCR